ncbi:hypothetical protein B566_EDAN006653 [Ephemera danica]|nr:hypothetical protein B566_EDAN006653 [Ephemera danica]
MQLMTVTISAKLNCVNQGNGPLRLSCHTEKQIYSVVPKDFSTVCSRHFRPLDFRKNSKKRVLVPTAVPSIFPCCPSTLDSDKRPRKSKLKTRNVLPTVSTINLHSKPDNCEVVTTVDETNQTCPLEVEESSTGSHKNVGVQVSSLQTGHLEELRKNNVRLKAKHNKLCEQLKALSEKLALSERKVTGLPEHHQLQRVKKAKKSMKGILLMEQFKNYGKRQSDWNERTLQECLEWRMCDYKNYDCARKKQIVHLPSRITLDRFWKLKDPKSFNNHKKKPISVSSESKLISETPEKKTLNIPYFSNDATCDSGELQVVIIDSTPATEIQPEVSIEIDVSTIEATPLNWNEILGSENLPTSTVRVRDTSNSGEVIYIEMSPF